ncbi:MAG TPA: crosslink repair DNA glycosylase YcaQ family protein [Bryobacteraceae bacterium]|nr:crosslink repair DNA glycosylase YcaQ family protein [Bryobacteraceae bacterium]
MSLTLSLVEARSLAIASQGFGARPLKPTLAHVRNLGKRLHAFQIDSVNVLVRAHYVPAFARLGPYPIEMLDRLAYQKREFFEYWGHAACLMPVSLYPLVRYRMHKHTGHTQEYMRSEGGCYLAKVYAEVVERGPIAAGELSDPGKRATGWWSWWGSSNGKAALEHLYDAGLVAIAGRRGFERLYDIAERVIPQAALDAPMPPREEAMKQLICLGARAHGVGTIDDFIGYFDIDSWRDRLPPGPIWTWSKDPGSRRAKSISKRLAAELVEEKRLVPVRVETWNEQAYMHPDARVRPGVEACGLVTPFDSLVWDRGRLKRLFGMKYSIEMYTPPPKRVYGYYVCPFLLGQNLVARCDLKADRANKILMVQSAFLEPKQDPRRVVPELASELRRMQEWLQLDRIEAGERGDLTAALRRSLKQRASKVPTSGASKAVARISQ